MEEIESISEKVGKDKFEILKIIEIYSNSIYCHFMNSMKILI